MSEPIRITAEETRQKVTTGAALLVCAYDDKEKFNSNHLEGALSFEQFQKKEEILSKDQEIIFYCA